MNTISESFDNPGWEQKKAKGKADRKITTATHAHPQKESLTRTQTQTSAPQQTESSAASFAAGVRCR